MTTNEKEKSEWLLSVTQEMTSVAELMRVGPVCLRRVRELLQGLLSVIKVAGDGKTFVQWVAGVGRFLVSLSQSVRALSCLFLSSVSLYLLINSIELVVQRSTMCACVN
jgi:hypothetical protein